MSQNLHQDSLDKKNNSDVSNEGETTVKVSKKATRSKKSVSAFRTISEVASELGVQQHVLRFWESKFSQIKPLKRGGGRRYYRPEDVQLLQRIHNLLYGEGYTIRGVQKLLKSTRGSVVALDKKVKDTSLAGAEELAKSVAIVDGENKTDKEDVSETVNSAMLARREVMKAMLNELKSMRKLIDA